MATFTTTIVNWAVGFGNMALGAFRGRQSARPGTTLNDDTTTLTIDAALQIATVWSCVDRRSKVVGSLPFFVYETKNGQRQLARSDRLYGLLHDSPNARMTPMEFWVAMMMNRDMRGNSYARIERADPKPDESLGEAIAMWPMPSDQVQSIVLDDGSMVFEYRIDGNIAILAEENVLHLKDLGNGTTGLPRLDYMRSTTTEVQRAQNHAIKTFANGGKPSGILMTDKTLKADQRASVRERFAEMAQGPMARLHVLEAEFKYQPLTMSPEDIQLLSTRQYGVEEICRWFDVPPVLVHHSNVTAWGSGIEQIYEGWHKLSVMPILVSIEQAVRKRVMTSQQRARLSAEFNYDALLRSSLKDRAEIYAKQVQNGLKTRNECRQLENDPPIAGGNDLTVQSNLLPIGMLGKIRPGGSNASAQNAISQ